MRHLNTYKLFEFVVTKTEARVDGKSLTDWFGDSKAVDKSGKPRTWYHGTNRTFDTFDMSYFGHTDEGYYGHGFYFTAEELDAEEFGSIIMEVYLKVENPFWLKRNSTMGHAVLLDVRDDVAKLPGMPESLETNRVLPNGYYVKKMEGPVSYGDRTVVYSVYPKEELYGTDKEIYGPESSHSPDIKGFNDKTAEVQAIVEFNDEIEEKNWDVGWTFGLTKRIGRDKLTKAILRAGHDGIFVCNVDEIGQVPTIADVDEIVIFDSNQIKSATGNTGRFGEDSDNIYEKK